MLPADLAGEQAKVLRALEGTTPGNWSYQHGWGIQVSNEKGLGLLIWAESGARANPKDQELMAAAPDLARQLAEALAELERVTAERDGLLERLGLAGERWRSAGFVESGAWQGLGQDSPAPAKTPERAAASALKAWRRKVKAGRGHPWDYDGIGDPEIIIVQRLTDYPSPEEMRFTPAALAPAPEDRHE